MSTHALKRIVVLLTGHAPTWADVGGWDVRTPEAAPELSGIPQNVRLAVGVALLELDRLLPTGDLKN